VRDDVPILFLLRGLRYLRSSVFHPANRHPVTGRAGAHETRRTSGAAPVLSAAR
jgi:hypothetical protein